MDHANDISAPKHADNLGPQFEEILMHLGGNGRYQKYIVFLVLLPMCFASSIMASAWLFITSTPTDHWCRLPLDNLTSSIEKSLLPMDENETSKHAECRMFDLNYTEELEVQGGVLGLVDLVNSSRQRLPTIPCTDGWGFDRYPQSRSLASEFGLVCGKDFLTTLAFILPSLGSVIGIPFGGYLADRFGRKPTYFAALLFFVGVGTIASFIPTYVPFLAVVCIQNIASSPVYTLPYMIGVEILPPDSRSTFAVLLTVLYTMGGVVFTGLAYFVRDWRWLLFSSTSPFLLFSLYWFIMPESPRFLLQTGSYAKAEKWLRIVARVNRKDFGGATEGKFRQLTDAHARLAREDKEHRKPRASYFDFFRTPNMRRKILLLTYLACNVNVVYSGLSFYAPSLGSDPYLSFFLASLIEIPSSIFTQLTADRVGRRTTMVVCFAVTSIACFGTAFLPNNSSSSYAPLLILFMIAKMCITSAFTVQELVVHEICPTVLRGEGVALTNIVGYSISNFGPIIVSQRAHQTAFPMVVFGATSVIGILCALALPETLHMPLPETVAEVENSGKKADKRQI
ncbi:hypothetical protein RvY_05262 [Ramazzottius varieornatus]|uniref:Major facilitator superfamily (MFS) profile domain-containing protein n=1 Tax=Ramazzottius varieornatus TaxID=947166 RepID=A0A1D1UUH6_RAMVA|nr:hypothetical protein RvY_05262 [Ramazzottius varieornatus]